MKALWGLIKRSPNYANFEDVQQASSRSPTLEHLMINTLAPTEQHCLIRHTVSYDKEENLINDLMKKGENPPIIVYGKNSTDETADTKYKQLVSLGFSHVRLYRGGLFEWLLLQDIYGEGEFPTTSRLLDLLRYKCVVLR